MRRSARSNLIAYWICNMGIRNRMVPFLAFYDFGNVRNWTKFLILLKHVIFKIFEKVIYAQLLGQIWLHIGYVMWVSGIEWYHFRLSSISGMFGIGLFSELHEFLKHVIFSKSHISWSRIVNLIAHWICNMVIGNRLVPFSAFYDSGNFRNWTFFGIAWIP